MAVKPSASLRQRRENLYCLHEL